MAGYLEDLHLAERDVAWREATGEVSFVNDSQRRAQIALGTVPAEDRPLVGLHRNYLMNTDAWRPSDALSHAVTRYHQGYRHSLDH